MLNDQKGKYSVFYGKYKGGKTGQEITEISIDKVDIFENFNFYDYSFFDTNIGNLKEYFLINFCQKYPICKCQISVYYKDNNKYHLIRPDTMKLEANTELYIINIKPQCNCEFEDYKENLTIPKFDLFTKLKIFESEMKRLEDSNKKLTEENIKLRKANELKYHINPKFEDFYDIVIDINSIKKVNTDGWKVKFTENGLNKYNEYKDKDLITIGVIGNNNKGKSFLLSKISKIELLTGTSIQTEGLSIKYPELKGYKERQIILLDSAGLETPVLKSENNENKINDKKDPIPKIEDEKNKGSNENNINNENVQIEKEKENEQNLDTKNNPTDKEIEQNREFKENARDKIMTELFLENFIIRNSDILLIVVGKLTYSEQLLINKIKVESKKQNKGKIFIIHNLQEFRTKEQVEDYIENSLLKCSTFNLIKRTKISTEKNNEEEIKNDKKDEKIDNVKIKDENKINENQNIINTKEEIPIDLNESNNFIINEIKNEKNEIENDINNNHEMEKKKIGEKNVKEDIKINDVHFNEILKYDDKKLEIHHLIIANEDSDAGKIYNPYAYTFIEKVYNFVAEPKKFDIFEQIKANFKMLSDLILLDKIENVPFTDNERIIKDKLIKLEYEEELKLKKCYIDELGFSLFKTGNFEPKYNYFKPDENTLEIRLEVPGNVNCDVNHKIIGDKTIITINGNKKNDNQPKEPNYNLFNIREFSEFELNIPLKAEDLQISKIKEGYPKFKNGICIIQCELTTKAEALSAAVEDKEI